MNLNILFYLGGGGLTLPQFLLNEPISLGQIFISGPLTEIARILEFKVWFHAVLR